MGLKREVSKADLKEAAISMNKKKVLVMLLS